MLARLTSLRLPTLRGFVIERARQGTFRGFCTERARLGTFSGLGTERERRLKEARAYRLSHCYNKIGFLSDISTNIIQVNSGRGCLGVGGWGLGGGVGDWVGVSDGGGGIFKKNDKKMTKNVPKRLPTPAKTKVLHEKNVFFLLKMTTQPRKKLKYCIKK